MIVEIFPPLAHHFCVSAHFVTNDCETALKHRGFSLLPFAWWGV